MIVDSFGRKIDYLRISLTDRCNLACRYCMPVKGLGMIPRSEILSFEELERIIEIFKNLGIKKFRFTGGEPLVRRGVLEFFERLDLDNFYLTTNLVVPNLDIERLNNTGLSGINVSCDSLVREKYRYITRGGDLKTFLSNLERLRVPVKLNVVVIRGFNDNEIRDFINFGVSHDITVRFIEKMNFRTESTFVEYESSESDFISLSHMRNKLTEEGVLEEDVFSENNSVARYFRVKGKNVKVGFITHISNPFCNSCNRIRIKANGELKLCLFDRRNYSLRELIRREKNDCVIGEMIKDLVMMKRKEPHYAVSNETAAEIGG